jgi:hypothetical protein
MNSMGKEISMDLAGLDPRQRSLCVASIAGTIGFRKVFTIIYGKYALLS